MTLWFTSGQIVGFTRVIRQLIRLRRTADMGWRHHQQFPITLPQGVLAEQFNTLQRGSITPVLVGLCQQCVYKFKTLSLHLIFLLI